MAIAELDRARTDLAAEWRARNPQTPEEVAAFYREADGLQADLDAWHEQPARQAWTQVVVAAAQSIVNEDGSRGARRVLDVGCGAGHDLRALMQALPDAALDGVEPNKGLRKALNKELGDDYLRLFKFPHEEVLRPRVLIRSAMEAVPHNDFDLISCIDVLEHVPDPERLVMDIIDRLRMGGIFVEATATHDTGTPLHLPELRGWSPGRILDRYGFVLREQVDRVRIWQRVSEHRTDAPHALLCAYRTLTVETSEALTQLACQGWRHSIHRGDALISRVRSIAVSHWLRETDGDVFLMIDDDIVFSPEDAEKVVALAREKHSIACAAYPVRGATHFACRLKEPDIRFGPDLPPVEIEYAGTGFVAVHRGVCEAIIAANDLPLCHPDSLQFWPLFQPLVVETPDQDGHDVAEYLSEDWSFCFRAKQAGFQVWLDPTVFLTHLGQTGYTVHNMTSAQIEPVGTESHG